MRKLFLAALVLFVGCGGGEKTSSASLGSIIVLECSGQRIDLVSAKHDPASYLIKIDPNNTFNGALNFYDDNDKRFVSPCVEKFGECKVDVGSDLITESGVIMGSDSELLMLKITRINRRTGEMRVTVNSPPLEEKLVFEGECKKGELPAEEPQKF